MNRKMNIYTDDDLLKYVADILSRSSPLEYPLPYWVKEYLNLCEKLGTLRKAPLFDVLPKRHLDWSNVPTR